MDTNVCRPRVALTVGDPAGVGPELAARLLGSSSNLHRAEITVLASLSDVTAGADAAHVDLDRAFSGDASQGTARLDDDGFEPSAPVKSRVASLAGGEVALHNLRRAVALHRDGLIDAIVFTPLNKASLHMAGMTEHDELRWFANQLSHEGPTSEINVLPGLWTARTTSHVSLAKVSEAITTQNVHRALRLLDDALKASGISQPRIGVAALNPHAGEDGLFGREEIDSIAPAVALARDAGVDAVGPLPADTIFLARDRFDGILTQFHDQGQIAVKLLGFDGGVTIEGGLPLPVTTPAHGTAFDITGKGIASVTSSQNALDIAIEMARRIHQVKLSAIKQ